MSEFEKTKNRVSRAVLPILGAISLITLLALSSKSSGGDGRVETGSAAILDSPRVVVSKSSRTLYLFDGERLVRSYRVDLGRIPIGQKLHEDDGRTPEGSFRVVLRNAESKYHRFIGLNFPNEPAAKRGVAMGLISAGAEKSIKGSISSGLPPVWKTPLGGGIGIHGHANGTDWTAGCIAVSDAAVEELFDVLRVGDPVEILP